MADTEQTVEQALDALWQVRHEVFGTQAGDEPDVFADYDRAVEVSGMFSRALETLNRKLRGRPPMIGDDTLRVFEPLPADEADTVRRYL